MDCAAHSVRLYLLDITQSSHSCLVGFSAVVLLSLAWVVPIVEENMVKMIGSKFFLQILCIQSVHV